MTPCPNCGGLHDTTACPIVIGPNLATSGIYPFPGTPAQPLRGVDRWAVWWATPGAAPDPIDQEIPPPDGYAFVEPSCWEPFAADGSLICWRRPCVRVAT